MKIIISYDLSYDMIQYFILFLFSFGNMYFIGKKYCNSLGLSHKDFISFILKINSVIHGLCIWFISVKYLHDYMTTDVFLNYLEMTKGYLIYDTLMLIILRKEVADLKVILLHHVIFFIALHSELCYEYPIVAATGLYSEVTNLFLYFGWYLVKIRRDNSILFIVNGLILLILFFVYRVLTFVNLFVISLAMENILKEQICIFCIMSLNLVWFVKLLEKSLTSLSILFN